MTRAEAMARSRRGCAGSIPATRMTAVACAIVVVGKGGVGKSTLSALPGSPAGPIRAPGRRGRRRRAAQPGRHPGHGPDRVARPSSRWPRTPTTSRRRPAPGRERAPAGMLVLNPDTSDLVDRLSVAGARRCPPGRHGRGPRGGCRVSLPGDRLDLERRGRHAARTGTTWWSWTRTRASSTSAGPWRAASTRWWWSSSPPSTPSRLASSRPHWPATWGSTAVHLVVNRTRSDA